jgi:hypothetical protein
MVRDLVRDDPAGDRPTDGDGVGGEPTGLDRLSDLILLPGRLFIDALSQPLSQVRHLRLSAMNNPPGTPGRTVVPRIWGVFTGSGER